MYAYNIYVHIYVLYIYIFNIQNQSTDNFGDLVLLCNPFHCTCLFDSPWQRIGSDFSVNIAEVITKVVISSQRMVLIKTLLHKAPTPMNIYRYFFIIIQSISKFVYYLSYKLYLAMIVR